MVSRYSAANLMTMISDLTYIYERSRSVSEITPSQLIPVKGQNYLLVMVKKWIPFIEHLSTTFIELKSICEQMKKWDLYLDKKYAEQSIFLGPPINLDNNDAQQLTNESLQWRNTIINVYANCRGTILIKEENFDQIFPTNLLSSLDDATKEDLIDGFYAIIHLLPTPASMILFRVAESLVRKYYEKITGKKATNQRMRDLIDELEKSNKVKQSLTNYLNYIRDRRNEAEHPDKRFTQEESERILLHIKELLVNFQ